MNQAQPDLSLAALTSAIAVGTIGAMIIWIVPGFVALAAAQAHLDNQQVGYVASWDINAAAAMMAVSVLLLHRLPWRLLVAVALALIVVGHLSTALCHTYGPIIAARVIAGAGEGLAIGVAFAALGQARNPDRAFAIYLVSGGAVCAGILLVRPGLQQRFGPEPLFLGFAGIAGVTSIGVPWFPTRVSSSGSTPARRGAIDVRLALSGLTAVFLYFMAQGALWSYFDRIGQANAVASSEIGHALAVSTLAGIGGALLAAAMPARLGRRWPLLLSGAVSVVSFLILLSHLTAWTLLLAGVLLIFAWNFSQPLFSGLCCEADPEGRVVCAMGSIQTVGYGLGPAAAALLLVHGSFTPIVWMSIVLLLSGVAIVLVGMGARPRASALETRAAEAR
jgi:DHA1 family inner membrane transport protein